MAPDSEAYAHEDQGGVHAIKVAKVIGTQGSELHSGSRPHPGRRQSQYSWAQIRLAAYSQGSRPSAEVPETIYPLHPQPMCRGSGHGTCTELPTGIESTRNMEAASRRAPVAPVDEVASS